jgi:hypothetical protein
VSATRVDLTWTAGSDANGVTANQIFRNGSLLTTVGAVTSFSDATTAPGTPYSYEVKAVDAAGNVSPASNTASVTTPAAGATLTFTATDDTYAQGDTPGTIYGSSTQVVVDNSPVRQMYLKFAVTGVGARPITSAKLRLHCVNGSPVGGVFHRIDPLLPWSESTLTWLTAPAIDSATVGALGSVAAGQTYDVPVTPLVTGDGTVAIGVTSANADGAYYDSKEGAAGAAPQLVVTTG